MPKICGEDLSFIVRKMEKKEVALECDALKNCYKNNYGELLSKEQQVALHCLKGQYLVIAGAGSGKTRTMVYRSAYLIENGVQPEKILMITFTKKAAEEMQERLEGILEKNNSVNIMTFHSLCAKIIYKNKSLFGIDGMKILGEDEKYKLIEKFFKLEELGNIKITLKDVIDYIENIDSDKRLEKNEKRLKIFTNIYQKLTEYKIKENLLEFEDLIKRVNEKFNRDRRFLEIIRNRIDYLIVDEYQDSNREQRIFLKHIIGNEKNLMVVGDDFQSIYGFRGADATNILKFGEDFPKAKLIKLQTNYRSADEIIEYTNRIAREMKIKYNKKIKGIGKKGGKIYRLQFKDEDKQWDYLCKKIKTLNDEGVPYSEIAILYRNKYVVKNLIKLLMRENIPFYSKESLENDGVSLLSVHSSKGLEWSVVFLPCMLDGIFPSFNDETQLEEEKRLYYVACSRAKEYLYLMYPKFFYEKTGYYEKKSRFLSY